MIPFLAQPYIYYVSFFLPFQVSLPSKSPPSQRGSYMFYALEPNSQYEVVIQSQNRWGWSENSDPFFFSTRANGKIKNIEYAQNLR